MTITGKEGEAGSTYPRSDLAETINSNLSNLRARQARGRRARPTVPHRNPLTNCQGRSRAISLTWPRGPGLWKKPRIDTILSMTSRRRDQPGQDRILGATLLETTTCSASWAKAEWVWSMRPAIAG